MIGPVQPGCRARIGPEHALSNVLPELGGINRYFSELTIRQLQNQLDYVREQQDIVPPPGIDSFCFPVVYWRRRGISQTMVMDMAPALNAAKIFVYGFSLVFCAIGLGVGYGAVNVFQDGDTKRALLMLLAALAFGGFGLAVYALTRAGFRTQAR